MNNRELKKFYNLKHSLDALEKGFHILYGEEEFWEMGGQLMSNGNMDCFKEARKILCLSFEVLPKKEKVKVYPVLLTDSSGDITSDLSIKFKNKEDAEQWFNKEIKGNLYDCPTSLIREIKFVRLLTEFPEFIEKKIIEIHYE